MQMRWAEIPITKMSPLLLFIASWHVLLSLQKYIQNDLIRKIKRLVYLGSFFKKAGRHMSLYFRFFTGVSLEEIL
jgi:hypothetical protein